MWRLSLIIAKRILRQTWRDKRAAAVIVLVPAVAMILFGAVFGGEVRNIPVAVMDGDKTDTTRSLVDELLKAKEFRLRELPYTANYEEVGRQLVKDGKYQWVVVLLPGTQERIIEHYKALLGTAAYSDIPTYIDSGDPWTEIAIKRTIGMRLMDVSFKGILVAGERLGTGPPMDLKVRRLGASGVRYVDAAAPAIMGFVLTMLAVVLTVLAVVRERLDGTLERVAASPLSPGAFAFGYFTAFGFLALIQTAILLGTGFLAYRVALNGSLFLVFLVAAVYALGSVAVGLSISALAKNGEQAGMMFPLVVVPSLLLSGTVWPIEALPRVLRWLPYLVPLTYTNWALRGIMIKGQGLAFLWLPVTVVIVFAALAVFLAVRITGRQFRPRG